MEWDVKPQLNHQSAASNHPTDTVGQTSHVESVLHPQLCYRSRTSGTENICIHTKVHVYQTLVLSVLLYASKMWTLLASDMKAIESFHMKCQRRILRIRWHSFVRNT